jgi:glycosyltransferase involved in cell wall biosynthesis
LASLRPDLVHFPQYNVPILYRGKFVVTIHDLIKSEFAGKSASTKGPLVYWTKQIGYELAVRVAARFSRKIIVPTNVIKEKISKNLNVLPEKIQVTYEAADEKFFEWGEKNFLKHEIDEVLAKYYIRRPFIIYVGNSYPYKNLNRLVDALKVLPKDLNLVNPCSRSVFYERLTTYAKEQDLADRVILPGFVPDDDLAILYRAAEAYVFPSLSEGFGIPALEAMASKLPVACSDIPVFHEVCGDNAIYFDPRDTADMASKIGQLINDSKLKERMVREGLERAHQFSWRKMAAQTLQIYEGAAR